MSPLFALSIALAVPAVPQAPIAAGPFVSLGELVNAAHQCGLERLRLEIYGSPEAGEARLFLDEEPTHVVQRCLVSWETLNGKRLRLKPRWWRDDFTKDAP